MDDQSGGQGRMENENLDGHRVVDLTAGWPRRGDRPVKITRLLRSPAAR